MALRRSGAKRTSAQDVAFVQMQLAAKARNQRWHDFLCAKRDELQARLRQQGYSQRTLEETDPPAAPEPGSEEGSSPVARETDRVIRWGASAPTDLSTQAHDGPSTSAPGPQAAEVPGWWVDETGSPL